MMDFVSWDYLWHSQHDGKSLKNIPNHQPVFVGFINHYNPHYIYHKPFKNPLLGSSPADHRRKTAHLVPGSWTWSTWQLRILGGNSSQKWWKQKDEFMGFSDFFMVIYSPKMVKQPEKTWDVQWWFNYRGSHGNFTVIAWDFRWFHDSMNRWMSSNQETCG